MLPHRPHWLNRQFAGSCISYDWRLARRGRLGCSLCFGRTSGQAWTKNRRSPEPAVPAYDALIRFAEFQRCGIDAVAQTGRIGAIFEQMSQVGVTIAANDFHSFHVMTVIVLLLDVLLGHWGEEAGPPASRIIFGVRTEQFASAADAPIQPLFMVVPVFACEGFFGSFLSRDPVLFGS